MKIVHEIHEEPQCSVSGSGPYRPKNGEEHLWRSWPCSVLIVSRCPISGEDDAIHIEGSADHVIEALETVLEGLRGIDKEYREEHSKQYGTVES